jgi:hypothetical protein
VPSPVDGLSVLVAGSRGAERQPGKLHFVWKKLPATNKDFGWRKQGGFRHEIIFFVEN